MQKLNFKSENFFYEHRSSDEKFIVFMHSTDPVSYISRRHYHRSIELGFMVRGHAGYVVNEHIEYILTGEMSFIDSWDVHYFDISKGNETYTLLLGVDYLRDFYGLYGDAYNVPYFDQALRDQETNKRVLALLREWEKKFDENDVLVNRGYVNLILAELAKGYPVRLREQSKVEIGMVNSILEYVNQNYQKNISLDDVAKALGYGKNYCSKLFHNYIDQDFRNYVNGVRIEAAKRMMTENPGKRITDVAFDCGFSSLNTFYRAYKRVYKNSPKRKISNKGAGTQ